MKLHTSPAEVPGSEVEDNGIEHDGGTLQQFGQYVTDDPEKIKLQTIREAVSERLDETFIEAVEEIERTVGNQGCLTLEQEEIRYQAAFRLRTQGLRDGDMDLIAHADRLSLLEVLAGSDASLKMGIHCDQPVNSQDWLDYGIGQIIQLNPRKVRERLSRSRTREQVRMNQKDLIAQMTAENQRRIENVLCRLGLTPADLTILPDERYAMQVAIMDSPSVKRFLAAQSAAVGKAIAMVVRGYTDASIARDTGIATGEVSRIAENFRNNVAKPTISQMTTVGKHTFGSIIESGKNLIRWVLVVRLPQPLNQTADRGIPRLGRIFPDLRTSNPAQMMSILNTAIPSSEQRNRRTLEAATVTNYKGQDITIYVSFDPSDMRQVNRVARALSEDRNRLHLWLKETVKFGRATQNRNAMDAMDAMNGPLTTESAIGKIVRADAVDINDLRENHDWQTIQRQDQHFGTNKSTCWLISDGFREIEVLNLQEAVSKEEARAASGLCCYARKFSPERLILSLDELPDLLSKGQLLLGKDSKHLPFSPQNVAQCAKEWPALRRHEQQGVLEFFSKQRREKGLRKECCKEVILQVFDYLQLVEEKEHERERLKKEHWLARDGWSFERDVAEVLRKKGYEVQVTPGANDGGIDLIIMHAGVSIIAQCKNHASPVGPAVVRELYGAMISHGASEAWLIASSGVTPGALSFTEGKPLRIIDLNEIIQWEAAAQNAGR